MPERLTERLKESLRYRTGLRRSYRLNKDKLGLGWDDYRALKVEGDDFSAEKSVLFRGAKTRFTSAYWFLHSVQEIFVDEVYRFIPASGEPVILDCGANIGLSVIYFKDLSPGSRIIAFEPDPSVFDLLTKNLDERKLSNVEIRNNAVWVDDSVLKFEPEGALGGTITNSRSDGNKQLDVQAVRLRDLLDERIDFLKIDIEGAEYDVLNDCRDKLSNVENLFVEYHVRSDETQRLDEVLSWLSNAGFRYYITEASRLQPHPFVSKGGDVFEMQLNISCYRTESSRKPDAS